MSQLPPKLSPLVPRPTRLFDRASHIEAPRRVSGPWTLAIGFNPSSLVAQFQVDLHEGADLVREPPVGTSPTTDPTKCPPPTQQTPSSRRRDINFSLPCSYTAVLRKISRFSGSDRIISYLSFSSAHGFVLLYITVQYSILQYRTVQYLSCTPRLSRLLTRPRLGIMIPHSHRHRPFCVGNNGTSVILQSSSTSCSWASPRSAASWVGKGNGPASPSHRPAVPETVHATHS